MKIIFSSVAILLATAAVATAQLSGLSVKILTGASEFGAIAPDPSVCGVIGGFALISVISARRLRTRG